jgi:hypothetical protein
MGFIDMNEVNTNPLSESELADNIYRITRYLVESGRVSGNTENITIERANRDAKHPCRRSADPNSLDLEQMEWAASKGHFWFLGPIKSLNANLDRGPIKGTLVSEHGRITFTTTINTLNYNDFLQLRDKMVDSSKQSGFRVDFKQPNNSYNVEITISAKKALSEGDVADFLVGIERVLSTT